MVCDESAAHRWQEMELLANRQIQMERVKWFLVFWPLDWLLQQRSSVELQMKEEKERQHVEPVIKLPPPSHGCIHSQFGVSVSSTAN